MKFLVVMALLFGSLAEGQSYHASDFIFAPVKYQCPSGEKSFDTAIVPACDNGAHGAQEQFRACDNGAEARLRIGKDMLKPKLVLSVGNVEILSGEGAIEFFDYKLSPKQIAVLNDETKKAPGHDGIVFIPAKIKISSGPCVHETEVMLRQYKDVIEGFASSLDDDASKEKYQKQCMAELSDSKLSAAYANAYVCVLKRCDEESKKQLAQERSAGKRSGFVNKILLANLGHYQELSSRYQEVAKNYIKQKGHPLVCNTKLTEDDFSLNVSQDIETFVCYGEVPLISISKNACFAAVMKNSQQKIKTNKVKIVPLLGTPERSIKNEFIFTDDSIVKAAGNRLAQDQGNSATPKTDPTDSLEPDKQVAALHNVSSEKHDSVWKIMSGPYSCTNMVGIIYVKTPPPLQMTKDFNPARIGNLMVSSHAWAAGLLPGDIVLSVKGVPPPQPPPTIGKDEVVPVEYSHDGEKHIAQIKAIESCPD